MISISESIKRCGYDTVLQDNSSKSSEGTAVHSNTPSKYCEQDTATAVNGIVNVKYIVKGEGKYSESLGKQGKHNNVLN